MTHQFFIYLIQAVFVGMCNQIDNAFSNNISIDAIVAFSTYIIIGMVMHHIAQIGTYAYRLWLNREWTCELVSISASVITGLIVLLFSHSIVRFWSLTEQQYNICEACIKIYAIGLPIIQFGDFLDTYLLFKSKIKQLMTADILKYAFLIGIDVLCIYYHKPLPWLIAGTVFSYAIFDLYMVFQCRNMLSEKQTIRKTEIILCIRHGANILFDKLTGRIANIYYTIVASHLGTELYAIHSICYAILLHSECITNSLNTFMIVRLKLAGKKHRYYLRTLLLKKYYKILTPLYIISIFPQLLLIHGDVPLLNCLPWMVLYCVTDHIALLFYETNKAYLESQEQSQYLKYGGLVGGLIRILYVTLFYFMTPGLFGFATACTADYTARAIIYYIYTRKTHKTIIMN